MPGRLSRPQQHDLSIERPKQLDFSVSAVGKLPFKDDRPIRARHHSRRRIGAAFFKQVSQPNG